MVLGGILCYPTMIEQKKGIIGIIKNVVVIIKQKLAKLLLFHVLQTVILVVLFILILLIFSLAMYVPGMFLPNLPKGGSSMGLGETPLGMFGPGTFRIISLGMAMLASPYVIHVILAIILLLYAVVIFGLLISWLLNFSCGLVAGFYLYIKDEVDFKDDLGLKKLNIDV